MVRLADLPEWEREHLLEKGREAPRFVSRPWVKGPALGKRRVAIEEAARYVASHLGEAPAPSYDTGISVAEALKRACDDHKAFYCEAVAAQPGNPVGDEIQKWFWRQTTAGRLFLDLQGICRTSPDKSMQMLGRSLLAPSAITRAT